MRGRGKKRVKQLPVGTIDTGGNQHPPLDGWGDSDSIIDLSRLMFPPPLGLSSFVYWSGGGFYKTRGSLQFAQLLNLLADYIHFCLDQLTGISWKVYYR